LYYFTPDELCDLVPLNGVAFASVHNYGDACGNINGEMPWAIQSDGLIHAKAQGNAHTYVHPDNAWLQGFRYQTANAAITWTKVTEIGSTAIFEFRRTANYVEPPIPRLGWADVTHDGVLEEHLADIAVSGLRSLAHSKALGPTATLLGDLAVGTTMRVNLVYGRATVRLGKDYTIVIPRGTIAACADACSMKPRNMVLLATAHAAVTRYLVAGNAAPDLIPRIALIATVAGFYMDVE